MAKVVAPLICKVEAIGRPKQSSYSDSFYHPVLFVNEAVEGDAGKIWKNLSPEEVSQLMKGDRVQLVPAGKDKNGNDKHNIIILDSSPTAPVQPSTVSNLVGLTDDQKRAIATFGVDVIKAYAFLYQQATDELQPLGASEEAIRDATSAALIAAQKRGVF